MSVPLTESAAYDLVLDDGERLYRLQVRFAATKAVELRRIHSNSQGYVVKRTKPEAYDWLYVLRPDGSEYLVRECLAGRRAITPTETDLVTNVF